jgi:formylglycine-generating enzyme required for sulfatase activity
MFFAAAVVAAASVCGAVPVVDPGSVTMTQDSSRRVTIEYVLSGAPGIVTFDIQTNMVDGSGVEWVSIGASNVTHAAGDVNMIIQPSENKDDVRRIVWMPMKAWPGRKIAEGGARAVVTAWSTNAPPDYMVVNLSNGQRKWYESVDQLPEGIDSDLYRTDEMVLRRVHAAGRQFACGSPIGELGRGGSNDESYYERVRWVTLTKDYYLGVFEVTHAQFRRVRQSSAADKAYFTDEDALATRPCDYVPYCSYQHSGAGMMEPGAWPNDDYDEARKTPYNSFFGMLRSLTGMGSALGLPTSAQWEFACRAGSRTALPDGAELSVAKGAADPVLSRYARYRYNGGYAGGGATAPDPACTTVNGTARVGSYLPNAWGFYDMLGNVREWCYDVRVTPSYASVTDPKGGAKVENNTWRTLRGGAWNSEPCDCRSGYVGGAHTWAETVVNGNNIGFRVCFELP